MWGWDHLSCVSHPSEQTTWPQNLSQAHVSAHAHWGTFIPKTTLARTYISVKHWSEYQHQCISSVLALLLCRIQCNASTLALQACRLNICSRGQQEHPLSAWHSLPTEMQAPDTRLVAQAGCHKWGSREAKKAVLFICLFIYLYLWGATAVTRVLSQKYWI